MVEFVIITWNLTEKIFQVFIFEHNVAIGDTDVASLCDNIE